MYCGFGKSADDRGGGGFFASFGTSLCKIMISASWPLQAVATRRPFSIRWDIPQRYEDGSSGALICPDHFTFIVICPSIVVILRGAFALARCLQLRYRSANQKFRRRAKKTKDEDLIGQNVPVLVGYSFPFGAPSPISTSHSLVTPTHRREESSRLCGRRLSP
jgi:hypothetical protein